MPKRDKIEKLALKYLKEFFGDENNGPEVEVCEDDEEEEEVDENVPTASTFAQSLQEKIRAKTAPKNVDETETLAQTLKSEMRLFEATKGKQMGENLQKLFVMLKNIAPTSIASEQSFSIAANFVTKIRSCLSDQTIDDLCFEMGYFANEKLSYV